MRSRKIRHVTASAVFLALGLCACATAPPNPYGPPLFDYTDAFRDKVVVPILMKEVDDYRNYTYRFPIIAKHGDDVALVYGFDFSQTCVCECEDFPYVTILVDPRTKEVHQVIVRHSDD